MGRDRWLKNRDVHPSAAIDGSKLASESVTTTQIDDGTIATADLADGCVTAAKCDETIARVVAADVSITAAQVANLHTTALPIVAAQGAGKAVLPIAVLIMNDYSGGAYGNVAAGDLLELSASSTPANTYGACLSTGILDATADAYSVILPATVTGGAVTANAALYLGLAGAVTIDSSTSTLKVRTYYRVLPTTFA